MIIALACVLGLPAFGVWLAWFVTQPTAPDGETLRAARLRVHNLSVLAQLSLHAHQAAILHAQARVMARHITFDEARTEIQASWERTTADVLAWCDASLALSPHTRGAVKIAELSISLRAGNATPKDCAALGLYR